MKENVVEDLMDTLIFIIIVLSLGAICLSSFYNHVKNIEGNVGEKTVLKTDTLMIINYSILDKSYILEDGRVINFKLLNKVKL